MQLFEEQKFIEEYRQGDLEKFGAFYDFYADKIYRFIYFRTRHKETAEDLTSQTFFKALRGMTDYKQSKGQFSSWLYCIAKNTLVDHYRASKNNLDINALWGLSTKEDLVSSAEIKEQIRQVAEALIKLNEEQREIIMLRVWDGLSYKEISEILGKTEASCKMSFCRAVGKLRAEYGLALIILVFLSVIVN